MCHLRSAEKPFIVPDITPIMANQMEKKMENEMETREYMGIIRV